MLNPEGMVMHIQFFQPPPGLSCITVILYSTNISLFDLTAIMRLFLVDNISDSNALRFTHSMFEITASAR